MFDVRQNVEESMKQFLNRFNNVSMKIVDPNEGLLIKAFVKWIMLVLSVNPYTDYLLKL